MRLGAYGKAAHWACAAPADGLCDGALVFTRFVLAFLPRRLDELLPARPCGGVYCNWFSAVPRVVLYDNLKSAVLERTGDAIRFNPTLLELAGHYRFEPRPVAPARGNEKGRVERAIRFVRDAFFAARKFRDLDDLNAQAAAWCEGPARDRSCPEDRSRSVRELFEQEKPYLLALPDNPFACEERIEVKVHKTPYVRFDWNDYTVPHDHVNRTLTVMASLDRVRVLDREQVIATHARSFERGKQSEDPQHIEALVDRKCTARVHRAQDRLHHAAPSAKALFMLAAQRGANLGVLTRGLSQLLDVYGAHALEAAIAAALAEDAVRHFIDAHAYARGQRPPIAVSLPNDPRLTNLSVPAQPLTNYDQLTEQVHDERCDHDPNNEQS